MFKAQVLVGYGTGAPLHRTGGGTGVSLSKSPKKAIRQAERQADRKAGWLSEYGLIYREVRLTNMATGETFISY